MIDIVIYAGVFALVCLALLRNASIGCWHDWGKWEKYLLTMQKRNCNKCGLMQTKAIINLS